MNLLERYLTKYRQTLKQGEKLESVQEEIAEQIPLKDFTGGNIPTVETEYCAYHNKYIQLSEDQPLFINFCTTHIKTDRIGHAYMTVVPLTLESATGTSRIFEWSTFRVSADNQICGLSENDVIRVKV